MPIKSDNAPSHPEGTVVLFLKFKKQINSSIEINAQHIRTLNGVLRLTGKISVEMRNCQYKLNFETSDLVLSESDFAVSPNGQMIWAKQETVFDADYLKVTNLSVTPRNAQEVLFDQEDVFVYTNDKKLLLSATEKLIKPLSLWEKIQKAIRPLVNP